MTIVGFDLRVSRTELKPMDVDIKWGRKGGIVIAMLVGRFSSANADLFERMLEPESIRRTRP